MTLLISSVFTYDTDAGNYIQAVEAADGSALEPATRQAINNFVIGCKQDGIWTAIKASCILAGARTRTGALVPLVGAAPTSFNFVDANYNRKTGLVGNGSSTYLNSNRAGNADPQNSFHYSVYVSNANTITSGFPAYLGSTDTVSYNYAGRLNATNTFFYNRSGAILTLGSASPTGYLGSSRSNSSAFTARIENVSQSINISSVAPSSALLNVYARSLNQDTVNARLAFYSIGESLDLALLDARVTSLINAFAVAIP